MWIGPLDLGHDTLQFQGPVDVVLHHERVVSRDRRQQAGDAENEKDEMLRSHTLVPWKRDDWYKSRSAAPGSQGATNEHVKHT